MQCARPSATLFRRGVRAAVGAAAAACAAALVAVAAAQEPGLPTVDDHSDGAGEVVDTEVTPRARGSSVWTQVAGARYPGVELVPGSPTSFDVDLYAVSMRNTKLGFAGGAKCRAETPPEQIASCDEVSGNPAVGSRVPVVYRFRQLRSGDRVWEPMDLGEGSDRPGYVGAIGWIDADTAVAVGGTGAYPRREPRCETEAATCVDPAGAGRAWIYENERWRELDLDAQRAQGMGGLTAVAFNPDVDLSYGIRGAAGGLGQIWEWEDGTFARRVDRHSSRELIQNRYLFRYRVRQIRARNSGFGGSNNGYVAVTSGCCGPTAVHNVPRVLIHQRRSGSNGSTGRALWMVDAEHLESADPERNRDEVNESLADPEGGCRARWPLGSAFGVDSREAVCGFVGELGPVPVTVGGEHDETVDNARTVTRPDWRTGGDSYYALYWKDSPTVLSTPGGPEQGGEPPSRIISRCLNCPGIQTLTLTGTSRLVDLDGDSGDVAPGRLKGFPDWAVGEIRAARSAHGRQGLFAATHLSPQVQGDTVTPPPDELGELEDYEPTSGERVERQLSANYAQSTSYSLNALDMIEQNGVATGQGWAVGDRGAIVGLSETDAGAGPEPRPPDLGARANGQLPDDSAFRPVGSVTAEPGVTPADAEQPDIVDGEWRVRPAGPAKIAYRIVMSRTGEEGWALGSTAGKYGVSHFDGARWRTCDDADEPQRGLPRPDSACAGVEALFQGASYMNEQPVAAGRVPLEADDDPSNDDEFEVVAAVGGADGGILRYRAGRWRREFGPLPPESAPQGVAFSHPDEGWVLWGRPGNDNFPGDNNLRFYHWDGERWTNCWREGAGKTGHDDCDPNDRLPQRAEYGSVRDLVGAPGRVYAVGYRRLTSPPHPGSTPDVVQTLRLQQPVIVYREPGKPWAAEVQPGEHDPGITREAHAARPNDNGDIHSLAVVRRPDGSYEGWATGGFGMTIPQNYFGGGSLSATHVSPPASPLLRLDPGSSEWRRTTVMEAGAYRDYARYFDPRAYPTSPAANGTTLGSQISIEPGSGESSRAFLTQDTGRIFEWNTERRRWELMRLGRPHESHATSKPYDYGSALAVDGRGGFFAQAMTYMYHYSDREPRKVFREVPLPERAPNRRISALAGHPDGTLWAATNSDVLFRYRRETGWDRVRIPGWEPGRIVTAPAAANAIAVGETGDGVVVGDGGRIARFSGGIVRLDEAAGTLCDPKAPVAPCGTSRDLLSAAVAPGGSAIVAGDRLALLWRPAGQGFRAIARPEATANAGITAVSMPAPDRAWLTTDSGLVFAGTLSQGEWAWQLENVDAAGDLVAAGELTAITVDADGRGYALGRARMLGRSPDGTWHPIEIKAYSMAMPPGGGAGALVGEGSGVIRTLIDGRFEIARRGDLGDVRTGIVRSLALVPGVEPGQVEAWAVLGSQPLQRLLHYSSDAGEPLLRPDRRVRALPDAPAPREGELSVAVFGKSDCQTAGAGRCFEMAGLSEHSEELVDRIVREVSRRSRLPGGPALAVSTGDAVDVAGYVGEQAAEGAAYRLAHAPHNAPLLNVSGFGPYKLRRWSELVADRLEDEGVPFYGAIGVGDLSDSGVCNGPGCDQFRRTAKAGENMAWRQALRSRPAPWGGGEPASGGGIRFVPVPDGQFAQRSENVEVAEPNDGGVPRSAVTVAAGGASTHYAVDVVREGSGERVARFVFVDSSLGAVAQADPVQQPVEPEGGQLGWLERMLCVGGEGCSRVRGQAAVVVSNTPTYSYARGLGLQAAADGGVVESILLRHGASALLSGRLGWNGLYWATAPGLHYPCPGQRYVADPPERAAGCAAEQGGEDVGGRLSGGADQLAGALRTAGAPPPPDGAPVGGAELDSVTGSGLLPVAVASGAGGKFGVPGATSAGDGFWHGFSIVRVAAGGDPAETVVEQRPIYDWVGIEAQARTLRPGQRMTLRGFARGPFANRHGAPDAPGPVQLDRIDSDAVTHRYDLVRADPERPWVPFEDANGDYVAVDPRVATVDRETGLIRTGRGGSERTYAIGILSVGELAASYPLAFEPRRSFVPARAKLTLPPLARVARAPAAQPPLRLAETAPPPPVPPAAPGSPLATQTLQPPQPPALPSLPAAQLPPTPAPPAPAQVAPPPPPPAPPSIPPQQQPQPLALGAKLQAVPIVPSVNPPAPPPVNPAPPAGSAARKEAKQRQAATAKSEEGATPGDAPAPDDAPSRVNAGTDPSHGSSRLDGTEYAFTRLDATPSAQPFLRAGLYGGGLAAVAALMALAWRAGGSSPRRRRAPVAPAAARAPAARDPRRFN